MILFKTLNTVYEIKKLKSGRLYITRRMTSRAFKKMIESGKPYKIESGVL